MQQSILLVEDEAKTSKMVKMALESEGIHVDLAADGNDAVELYANGKYDLVILDLKLPGMTGEEVLKEIRRLDPYVEVIVYTNYSYPPTMKQLINLGIDKYVNKGPSADLWELVEKVKELLDPFSDNDSEALLNSLPEEMFNDEEADS